MNLGGKQDLDALLREWPAPLPRFTAAVQDEEHDWEERAEAIVRAAIAAKREGASGDADDVFLTAPALAPELGERAEVSALEAAAGEKKMSQENEPGEVSASTSATPSEGGSSSPAQASAPPAAPSSPGVSVSVPAPERKRQSLKEIAARASQSGARQSQPGVSPSVRPAATPSTPLPRPSEADKEDSGVINLNMVRTSATPQQAAAADKAQPAQAGLFDDDKPEAADKAPVVAKPSNVVPLRPKKSNVGAIGGVAVAVLGMAAAAVIMLQKRPPPGPPPAPVAAHEAATEVAPATAVATVAPAATAEPTAVAAVESTASPSDEANGKAEAVRVPGPLPTGALTGAAVDSRVASKAAGAPDVPETDLQRAMAKATGADGQAKAADKPAATPEPAAARNQNIPEQPSQGAVQGAVNVVMGAAKACVAGADEVSRATITFASSGAVTSVSVSGWAASHGKSGCIQAALKGAKVGPFSKPTFVVGIPIRP